MEEEISDELILQNRDKKAPISNGTHFKTAHIGDTDRDHQGKEKDAFPATTATHEDSYKVKMSVRRRTMSPTYTNIVLTPTACSGL